MKTPLLLVLSVLIFTASKAQLYQADWGYDLFGDELPDGLKLDTAYGYFSYTTTGDSLSLQTHAETRSVTTDSKGNSIDVSDYRGFYYEISSIKLVSLRPYGIIITKRNKQGTLLWKKYLKGGLTPIAWTVVTDSQDNILLCGHYSDSLDVNPDAQADSIIRSSGSSDTGFIIKLNASGGLIWAQNIVSNKDLSCYDVAVDAADNVYVVGEFQGNADFDPGPGIAGDTANTGTDHVYALKLDSNGKYLWHYTTITSKSSRAWACALDDSAALYVTGEFDQQVDFSGTGNQTITATGGHDAFIFKLDGSGNYQWVRTYGNSQQFDNEYIRGVGFDGTNVIIADFYAGRLNLDTGKTNFTVTTSHTFNSYVQKLDKQGNHVWATKVVTGTAFIHNIEVNDAGEAMLIGRLNTQGIFNLPGGPDTLSNQSGDWLVVGVSKSNQITWARSWNSVGNDWANDAAYIGNSEFVVAGTFEDELYLQPGSNQMVYGEGVGYEGLVIKAHKCVNVANIVDSSCGSYTTPDGNYTWVKSGIYARETFVSGSCDTNFSYQITIFNPDTGHLNASTCGVYQSPSGKMLTKTGVYYDSLTTVFGCDSVVVIDLTITHPADTITAKACSFYTVPSGTMNYQTSGTYYDTLVSSQGCDSILTIHLTVNHSTFDTLYNTSCDAYTFPSGSRTVYQSGFYHDTLTNHAGCDSILTLGLTINLTPDTSVVKQGDSLVVLAQGISYQWLRCDSGFIQISGDTTAYFVPSASGSYAVRVSQEGCADTSGCYWIEAPNGFSELSQQRIRMYPNPVTGDRIHLKLPETGKEWHLSLFDSRGKELLSSQGVQIESLTIPEQPGIYLLLVKQEGGEQQMFKVVRQAY